MICDNCGKKGAKVRKLTRSYGKGQKHFRGLKVAFVIQASKIDPDRFGETVAVNRGGNLLVFENMEAAYQWLEVMPVKDSND